MIWRRNAEHAGNPAARWYMRRQAERMFRFERRMCRRAGRIIAVSECDAETMKEMFGAERVTAIPTGVDIDYFAPPERPATPPSGLVFVGSMDWRPNIDGVRWFVREALPLIRRARPECTFEIVGRNPAGSISALAREDARIRVTGTVPDIRPYLWGSAISIVPLRIGGGTRLKIYESMAARVPVVSTTVGAEGLECHHGTDIRIADSPAAFASACLDLLKDASLRQRQAAAAWEMVAANFAWNRVVERFEDVLYEMGLPEPARRASAAGASGS
jgi:glycosyltransferase involved in cell wall biosynthesis